MMQERLDRLKEWKQNAIMARMRGDAPAGEGLGGWLTMSDGVRLFFQAWLPESPDRVVVCLHGMVSHGFVFALVADGLVPGGAAVYAPDHRGHGLSGGARADVKSLRRTLGDISEFLSYVSARHPGLPVFLLGESMGALFATNFTARRPEGLAGLILAAAPFRNRASNNPSHIPKIPYYAASALVDSKKPVIYTGGSKDYVFNNPDHMEWDETDPHKARYFPPHLLFRLRYMRDYARGRAYARIHMPTLLLQGEKDRLVHAGAVREFYDRLAARDKTMKMYARGCHAIFSDPECEGAVALIEKWTHERVKKNSS